MSIFLTRPVINTEEERVPGLSSKEASNQHNFVRPSICV